MLNPATRIHIARLASAMLILVALSAVRAAEPERGQAMLARVPELKTFIEAKERQAQTDTEAVGQKASPDVWAFFKAARTGNWSEAATLWKSLAKRSGQYENPEKDSSVCGTAAWSPLLEVELALEAFAKGEPKYAEAFGKGIVQSIPRGSIYFGGTDPGRGLPTLFSKSHADGDPFFTITQNALADGSYLEYLRRMYGGKIFIPSPKDSQHAFQEYLSDAQRRLDHDQKFPKEPKQLKPGETVTKVNGQVQVSGQVAVMAINGLLTGIIFDKNPDQEFYIEESFPLDWMYPHLSPHGLIMKINRERLRRIPEETLRKDHEFWSGQVKDMLGEWLTQDTSVADVCAFVERVYAGKKYDQFRGDLKFVQDENACKAFSKLRSSIAGLYAWRLNNSKSSEDKEGLGKEADFAFRQAFALCPYSPEAVFRYVSLLVNQARHDDALLVVAAACKGDPSNGQLENLRKELQRIKEQNSKKPR